MNKFQMPVSNIFGLFRIQKDKAAMTDMFEEQKMEVYQTLTKFPSCRLLKEVWLNSHCGTLSYESLRKTGNH